MIVRLLAAAWLVATLGSLSLGVRTLLRTSAADAAPRLEAFGETATRIGKWQFRPSMVLVIAAMQSFLAETLNTSLWPWVTAAWAAMLGQLLFIRPHMAGYLDIVRRGVARPVQQFLVVHITLDVVVVASLVALILNGVK